MKLRRILLAALPIVFSACTGEAPPEAPHEAPSPAAAAAAPPPPGVVEIVARGLKFEAPAEISPGWNTFKFRNESGMVHFALIERLPEGIGAAEQQAQVAPLFQQGMDLLNQGDPDGAMQKFGALPEWFGQIVFVGGPGFVSAGQSGQTTVYLEPGTYLIECYVKTGGVFHSYNPIPGEYGMVHEFKVTGDALAVEPPATHLTLTLSSERGIEISGAPRAGSQTVAVTFEDQKVYENFVGHDVHLVRLQDDADLDELAGWMDWRSPTGLETPAPALFLGGVNEMPAGATAYLTVDLDPGRYAWIAEVPDAPGKGLLSVFTVE